MTRIKRLTQRACETATPIEDVVVRKGSYTIKVKSGSVLAKGAIVKRRSRVLCDGGGLMLVVSPGKHPNEINRSWIYRYATGNVVLSANSKARREQKKVGLGSLALVSLERARELAELCRRQRQEGFDPAIVKQQRTAQHKIEKRKLHSLQEAIDEYLKRHGASWSADHQRHWSKSFHHISTLLDLPVSRIDRNMVVTAFEKVWSEHTNTAMRLRGRLEQVLALALVNGWCSGENPAQWSLLKHSFPAPRQITTVKHHDALPWQDAPKFMAALVGIDDIKARALEMVIRTTARLGEVIGATPEQFDLDSDNPTWTVPAELTKTGKRHGEPHIVPLSVSVVACLRRCELEPGKRIFTCHDRTVWKLSKQIDKRPSVHGWRATWKSFAGDHDFPREITEMQLQHRIGSRVEQAYQRSSYLTARKRLLDIWNEFLDTGKWN